MIDFLNTNIGSINIVWMIIAMVIISGHSIFILSHDKHLNNLKKTLKEMQASLLEEDSKISRNFDKIHNDLSLAEREIMHAISIIDKDIQGADRTNKKSFFQKPMGKKAQKFLTPRGKIKKQYRNNQIAQKCYLKFHNMQKV